MLEPLSAEQWDSTTAGHLLNRAGFGGAPEAIEGLQRLGLQGAVGHLVDYERIPDPQEAPAWAKPDPSRREALLQMRNASEEKRRELRRQEMQINRERMVELRGWWLERMANGSRPLQEKMTLFWHGHFATSVVKVRDPYYMWRQNELFRRLATGDWLELLVQVSQDPAMLIWLDQAQSRKEHPNENYAREVMELFTLGEGHYTETDVTEAARAFTGWSLDRQSQSFVTRPRWHDSGRKTVLGRTGDLDGRDVLVQIVSQPQAALFITAKIWNYFAGEPPAPALNAALAEVFRRSGNRFRPLLQTIFLSAEFYSPRVIRNQVKSPVQWLVGSVRMLETQLPPPLVSTNLLRNLGQDLFAPPNVKGWDGGVSWITTATLLARYNNAALLVNGAGRERRPAGNADPSASSGDMAGRRGRLAVTGVNLDRIVKPGEQRDADALIPALEDRLLQSRLTPKQEEALRNYLGTRQPLSRQDLLGAIRLVMSTPDYQVT
jgi:uncharacterized protein (DUF1800 family)